MSAASAIVPRIWATAAVGFRSGPRPPSTPTANPRCRKGPHAVRLVAAACRQPALRPALAPELAFYRKYTEAMLHRYLKLSLEGGRVPSLMGRELFRGDVSHCRVQGFDDVVIFCHDVGNCIARLTPGLQHLVRRIALQGYTHGETAAMLGISHKTVSRRYAEALDRLTSMLVAGKLLQMQEEVHRSA